MRIGQLMGRRTKAEEGNPDNGCKWGRDFFKIKTCLQCQEVAPCCLKDMNPKNRVPFMQGWTLGIIQGTQDAVELGDPFKEKVVAK